MPKKKTNKIDEEIEESFPASDPPSFMGGEVLGAPKGRRSAKPAVRRTTAKRKKPANARIAKKKAKPAKKKAAKKKSRR
jgi:hypothetical protein